MTSANGMGAEARLWLKRAERWLWQDHSQRPPWYRAGVRALQILFAVLRDLSSGDLSLRAMGLVYYTVIATVPLLALTFSMLKGLGAHNAMEPALLGVLEPFLGEYSHEITTNIVGFVDNIRVDVLGFVSLGVLIYTVLTMMKQMENAFNYIWSVDQARTLANRISEYLFAIIVSPLLILISVGIASYVNTTFFVSTLEGMRFGAPLLQLIAYLVPIVFMTMAFAFAYSFIPNTRVRFRSAIIGALVTTVAWKALSWVFTNFITVNSVNAVIYAAFFAAILLMLLIYLGWLVLLLGSSVAFYHQYPAQARTGRRKLRLGITAKEEITLTLAALIINRFHRGEPPWSAEELINYTNINGQVLDTALRTLMDIGFIVPTAADPPHYLPPHNVDQLTILELRKRIREHAFDHLPVSSKCAEQLAVRSFLQQAHNSLNGQLGHYRFIDLDSDTTEESPVSHD